MRRKGLETLEDKEAQGVAIPAEELEAQRAILCQIREGWAGRFAAQTKRPPRYAIATYGCQMNERDSQHLGGMLDMAGFVPGSWDDADLLLFNTCCVREHAEHRVFGNVGALYKRKQANPDLLIGVCGCMMQQADVAKRLYERFPFVDLVFGTHALYAFPALLARAIDGGGRVLDLRAGDGRIAEDLPSRRDASVSAFVTVMYGCDNYCSYCVVPYVRGRERSRRPGEILREIEDLRSCGVVEVTLLGQNVNSYGKDLGTDHPDFADLLRSVANVEGIERVRFMTSHPKDLSSRLIDAMAACPTVCRHIHLPVQSGSDAVLTAMNRRYTRARYLERLRAIRERLPGVELTTDIIVGFPGETEADFEDTLDLVRQAGFASAFTFMYSPRGGTPAASMDGQIPADVKKQRLLRLNELQGEMGRRNNESYLGQTLDILVEGQDERDHALIYGKSGNFKMVYAPGDASEIGKTIPVRVTAVRANALRGERTDDGFTSQR